MDSYLESIKKQFAYYKLLGERTFEQLTFEDLKNEIAEDSNSIAIIIKHLTGNMLSRWTNFLTEDGEKDWRQRDLEFHDSFDNKEDLIRYWSKGWDCLFNSINSLTNKDLERIIYIRNQGHTVLEAINRQLAHYSYHVGQIVLLGKVMKGKNWQSLSIPKGDSGKYNEEKFRREKERKHFIDDL